MASTRDYPEELVQFARSHPLMYNAVYPEEKAPLLVRSHVAHEFTAIAVDRVHAADGQYRVLFLGTDHGTIQKVMILPRGDTEVEELILEEVQVFRYPSPVRSMKISSKRQQLYVSSAAGVTQLSLHRCLAYGIGCADCCLARDPYCAWDGHSCSRYSPTSKRRSRRQDVRFGDPIRQCRGIDRKVSRMVLDSVQFGVEGSSTLLECLPRSPQASTKWLVQRKGAPRRKLVHADSRLVKTGHGLLIRQLVPRDVGTYQCVSSENGFSHVACRVDLRVLPRSAIGAVTHSLSPGLPTLPPPSSGGAAPSRNPRTRPGALSRYCQDLWPAMHRVLRPKRGTAQSGHHRVGT
ncbi:semaphorin-3F-like [Stegostoma tigrinum]|uniref:semaphorin-3F-like n=1 Tax=Stegostoma tigrinum TaxID=3053191 RepID=UPI0028704721|nr:semaphorin-3F-like [Stegostoma tigrinum]